MRVITLCVSALQVLLLSQAAPVTLPNTLLPDGYPNPSPAQLKAIEQQALGTLSNRTLPATLHNQESLNNFRIINFNEYFEAVFFAQFLHNVTNNVTGFEVPHTIDRDILIAELSAAQAQEELHTINAIHALQHYGANPIQPCKVYKFPVNNFQQGVLFAMTWTSLVMSTLQDIIQDFAENGDAPFTATIASTLGQEGAQAGYYRLLLGRTPNSLPFLTRSIRSFAFSILNQFIDFSTCPNVNEITIPLFKHITVLDTPGPVDNPAIRFAVNTADVVTGKTYYVVYINQQNLPVVVPAVHKSDQGGTTVFTGAWPYTEHLMNGLTITIISDNAGPYADAQAAADEAIFAPGLIIVN
ncbi:hypothetical protein TREMEDRAFT_73998 [Tremella mesenterica DSM 1558]|uniref:uncharacterized protein n=1 Tax=Tremella mesenterica (strain ATCC 24925 / CBS 8224 / DSM 1558 / NBRC 9311 / NRRL Y-6157 / RJB 2259-6 / UBC 559-6) TaxID=578456 RepID=UPI0003F48DF4|nr:uncharacterized protein TREMEDRAFT_73998 [Tremella mesenterica DSM 1558]EIW69011.1 hypothetical protein TREMEDRAFT_73998 [Tremella mesenterica DSM 1558]